MAAYCLRARPARAAPCRSHWTDRIAHVAMLLVALLLLAFLALPLLSDPAAGAAGQHGRFVGLANFIAYAKTPALLNSLWNSVWVSALVTLITVPLAFGFAYALTRSACRSSRCCAASRWCRCWRRRCCRRSR